MKESIPIGSVFVILCLICTSLPETAESKLSLSSLWSNKAYGADIRLNTRSELAELVEQSESDTECPKKIKQAITDLHQLVSSSSDNVCTNAKIDAIRGFLVECIDHRSSEELPKVVKNFFIAYGLHISAICKRHIVDSLDHVDQQHLLTQEDFDALEKYIGEKSIVASLINEPQDYDSLLLPGDIIRLTTKKITQDNAKLIVQTTNGQLLARLQAICEHRFRPVYDQVISPVVSLSNMGFNYKSKYLALGNAGLASNEKFRRWYRIAYVCGALTNIEIIDDPDFEFEKQKSPDRKVARLLTPEEANELKRNAEREGKQIYPLSKTDLDDLKQVVYVPNKEKVSFTDELVVDPNDKKLIKMIDKFDTTKTELARIKGKLSKKVGKYLLQSLKKKNFTLIGSMVFGDGGKKTRTTNEEMVQALDSFINDDRSNFLLDGEDGLVTPYRNPDKPVWRTTLKISSWLLMIAVIAVVITFAAIVG